MLTLTENARTVIRRLITRVDGAKQAGLRIGPTPGTAKLGVEIVAAPEPGDQVLEAGGARVFLDATASSSLGNKELDALVDGDSVEFSLRDRMQVVR
ncbi:hypothetical protein BH11ACT5_BH11ACT5_06610 [soil metagenome]